METKARHSVEYNPMTTESNLLFMISWMQDLLIRDIEIRAKAHNARLDKDTKRMFNQYNNYVRLSKNYFDQFIDKFCIETLYNPETKVYDEYERLRSDSNELLRFLLRYVEKTAVSPDNIDKIHAFMDTLDGAGLFKETDINRFNLNPR